MQGQISIDRGLRPLPVYEQTTRGIRVRVLPAFLADQSSPEEGRFLWSYTITIENCGTDTVQLLSRYWQITDEAGRQQEVRGPGVVGTQPVLEPGQSFEYTSGCPLPTASGAMNGRYMMQSTSDEVFEVEIPIFLLESPHERREIH
jgi:ApaG protein